MYYDIIMERKINKMKDFSHWKEYEGASEGSGRSEKLWLINPDTNQTGLFKLIESVFSRIAVNTGSMVSSSAQSSSKYAAMVW